MLGGNNGNRLLPVFLDETQFRHQTNVSNQLQLFGNLQAGCSVDPVNYFGNEHISSMIQPNKQSKEMEDISKQRLQISLNYNVHQDDADQLASIPNPNPVSTGLRLSYDDDERNSSVTSASGSMSATPSIILSFGDNIRTELDRQQEELDQYVKLQKEQLSKGVRDMKQKHVAALLTSIEKGINTKLKEKDVEIENMNRFFYMGMNKTIVWFRRDLRIEDNPALAAAAAAKDGSVFPVYIWCPKEEGQFYPGRVSRWWLKQSLAHLDKSLKSLGAELMLIKTDSTLEALLECVNAIQATKVVFNHLYDPVSLVRDHNIKEKLVELGISVKSYNGDLLFEPWSIYDETGHAFTTFDPFWNRCLHMQMKAFSLIPPQLILAEGKVGKCSIEQLGLEDESEKSSNALLGRAWYPGWNKTDKALTEFVEQHLLHYSKNRLKVGGDSTSLLSPYIHFGELSVRKVFQLARTKQILWANEGNSAGEESATVFLRAIGLREYSRYLCFNFPSTIEKPLLGNLAFFPWKTDPANFKAWRQGRTGYPLVDAGMRELWATGWIHNKIRVIVSSFAVKMLLIPWRWGMKYFWDTLLDADLESDILGWQYISGCLPDGHKLERLDDPAIHGAKFDPEGEYVRQWLPELARMPAEWIHHPWNAPLTVLRASGVELGQNYPKPIIDIDQAREQLTEAIFKMWENEAASKGSGSEERHEVVDESESLAIPKVFLKDKVSHITSSSNDQKVPTLDNPQIDPPNRKRPKCSAEVEQKQNNSRNLSKDTGVSSIDQDVSSTAESSCKRESSSSYSFSVPQ